MNYSLVRSFVYTAVHPDDFCFWVWLLESRLFYSAQISQSGFNLWQVRNSGSLLRWLLLLPLFGNFKSTSLLIDNDEFQLINFLFVCQFFIAYSCDVNCHSHVYSSLFSALHKVAVLLWKVITNVFSQFLSNGAKHVRFLC